jgi:hypothetical protein
MEPAIPVNYEQIYEEVNSYMSQNLKLFRGEKKISERQDYRHQMKQLEFLETLL